MGTRFRTLILAVAATLAVLVPMHAADGQPGAVDFEVEPGRVEVGTFFQGRPIRIHGRVAAGCDVVVAITGGNVEETYNRKGRVGPLWATVGKVTISEVPALHLVATSAPLSTILPRPVIDAHMADLDALGRRARILPDSGDRDLVVAEYLALKRGQGLVGLSEGAVRLEGTPGNPRFDATLRWPATAPIGTYRVVVWQVRGRVIIDERSVALEAAYVELPRLIAHLAFERSLAYGVVSVIIAVGVGFAMGLVFKKGPRGH